MFKGWKVASQKGGCLCSVPGPTEHEETQRVVKGIVSPGSEVAGTGLVGVRDEWVGGQGRFPRACPLDVILSGWQAGRLLHY